VTTVYTKDKAVGIAADDTISVEEAFTIGMAIIAIATIAIATIAAITTTVTQTREAFKKAIVKVEENIKVFNRRNTMFITN
jgi:hypothetical protein